VSVIKASPEDFVVDEIPAYEPSGEGDHVFVRFTKRDMTTDAAARAIAHALSADPRGVGIAGNKDKRAVTTQVISVAPPRGVKAQDLADQAMGLDLAGIRVVWAKRHGHKLKTGHLRANRFTICVRQLSPEEAHAVVLRAAQIAETGVPNAFGEQRFGNDGNNAQRARDILLGKETAPRDARLLRLLYSALQSAVFDAVLEERVRKGTWATALLGDVLKKTDTGGLFVCTDEQEDQRRALHKEVSATGPIFGPKMMRAAGDVGAHELDVARTYLGEAFDRAASGVLGDGTRRSLRLFVSDCRARVNDPNYNSVASAIQAQPANEHRNGEEEASCLVEFMLPKGAFATTVLSHILDR
jgi:tRNA pseudouridine13 synthase